MIRLNIIVEGQTEEGFIKTILAPHFGAHGIFACARRIATSRNRLHNNFFRGGCVKYSNLKRDLNYWFMQEQHNDVFFSTMIDLYKIPKDFPSFENAKKYSHPFERVEFLEMALLTDMMNHPRFIPYIQLHEFEALLFSDTSYLANHYALSGKNVAELHRIPSQFASPELIDDGEQTAPSKRIIQYVPEYENEKPFAGPLIAGHIGLSVLRKKCIHFNHWIEKIEQLAL